MGMIGHLKRVPDERLTALIGGNESLDDYIYGAEGEELDLDKAWHGIHYLLCGDSWEGEGPLFDALMGGTSFEGRSEEENVRYLRPQQTRDVAQALDVIDEDQLRAGFSPDDMNEAGVYPSEDWNEEGELDYVLDYYRQMKEYYKTAAERGEGMLIYIL
ncbi:YfbM family protein [Saccharibacillus sp. CPCC 101409]|uniref:YfbM family protein n=1 Tax=Saccharibacillus sp. CPCC 101409 TaxID=3058041 RepID=UPI0026733A09|nr:YfbM family protein [Saccharibacillus sp. CPCC 101409]MDO3411072.1 YfbM family protein [Saccharibacillus sp. CPCC 101409]